MRYVTVPLVLLLLIPPLTAADKTDVWGRWDNDKTDTVFIRFGKDGTFRWKTLIEEMSGKYRFLDGGVIEFTTTVNTPKGKVTRASEVKYKLEKEVLELKLGEEWHKYHKAK